MLYNIYKKKQKSFHLEITFILNVVQDFLIIWNDQYLLACHDCFKVI